MRAALVNARALAKKAEALALGRWLRLGRGEERSGGRHKGSILACAYEAVLGAGLSRRWLWSDTQASGPTTSLQTSNTNRPLANLTARPACKS